MRKNKSPFSFAVEVASACAQPPIDAVGTLLAPAKTILRLFWLEGLRFVINNEVVKPTAFSLISNLLEGKELAV